MGREMFNDDQNDYMDFLASLPREQKCGCGWAVRGDCYGSCYGKPEKGGAKKREPQQEVKGDG